MESPFKKASTREKKAKVLVWGSWGTGKTTFALNFPSPVVLDLEGGTDLYGGSFDFDVLRTSELKEFKKAIAYLEQNQTNYKTIVVDPVSILWENIQKYWSDIFINRLEDRKGHKGEFFEFGHKEWATAKSDFKRAILRIIALDMHVVMTAREANVYSSDLRSIVGVKVDAEKTLPHFFDMTIRLFEQNGKKMAVCDKFRTDHPEKAKGFVGKPFDLSYQTVAEKLGIGEESDN